MELEAGMRVAVGIDASGTAVAVIHRVSENMIELDLLEAFPEDRGIPSGDVTVFVPQGGGLHCWPAMAADHLVAGRLSLALAGPPEIVQRRRYERFIVELDATIRRTQVGRTNRAEPVTIIDLSHGGARAVGTVTLATGDNVVLGLVLGSERATIPGRVAMAYPDGNGRRIAHIAFDAPDDPSPGLTTVDGYLDSLEVQLTAP